MYDCLILAGGLGTRISKKTGDLPKVLIPVCGRSFLDYQLCLLKTQGIGRAVISVGHKGDQVKDFISRNASDEWPRVEVVDEGENLLGTGGAIRWAVEYGGLSPSFFVLYGDSYLPTSFSKMQKAFEAAPEYPAAMSVYFNRNLFDKSNVWFQDGRIVLYDKAGKYPEHKQKLDAIDYGLQIFKKDLIRERLSLGMRADIADLFHDLSVQKRLFGYRVEERFFEVGSEAGMRDFELFLEAGGPERLSSLAGAT